MIRICANLPDFVYDFIEEIKRDAELDSDSKAVTYALYRFLTDHSSKWRKYVAENKFNMRPGRTKF